MPGPLGLLSCLNRNRRERELSTGLHTSLHLHRHVFYDILAFTPKIVVFPFKLSLAADPHHSSCFCFSLFPLFLCRSLRQSVAHMRREAFEKEENEHKKEHPESNLQWGHHLWHPARQHGPRRPAHLCHGLRFVRPTHTHVSNLMLPLELITEPTDQAFWLGKRHSMRGWGGVSHN